MPMSLRRQCPKCTDGVGVAKSVQTVAERPVVIVTLACESCHHEWQVEQDSKPIRQTVFDRETPAS
jgi:transcription elongation factor Elf1